jgi:hypothetical protein
MSRAIQASMPLPLPTFVVFEESQLRAPYPTFGLVRSGRLTNMTSDEVTEMPTKEKAF